MPTWERARQRITPLIALTTNLAIRRLSLVQRHLRIDYNRAARPMAQMEHSGMISVMQSNGNRDVKTAT
ncbi:hypothetical protein HUX62_24810 [Massilia sp. BJB1822]|nr:hypothetical protein [Massilia sp. BJB1822]